jgi:hypothetical protein
VLLLELACFLIWLSADTLPAGGVTFALDPAQTYAAHVVPYRSTVRILLWHARNPTVTPTKLTDFILPLWPLATMTGVATLLLVVLDEAARRQ